MNAWNISDKAAALLRDSLGWDMCLPWLEAIPGRDLRELERFHKSGFDFVSLTLAADENWIQDTVRYVANQTAWVGSHSDKLVLARSVADIDRARKDGKLAVGFNFQGTNPFQGDTGMVQVYYDLGIRHALMAYNRKNLVGDGCHERTDAGLSRFGLTLIEEMNRVGMIVDCTHTGYRTTMDAMEASTSPCIFSHSVCRDLNDHERNIWDDQIKACAATGGVIGVNGIGFFMNQESDISADAVARHIDHIAELVGPQHVGIGLDFVYFHDFMLAYYEQTKATQYPEGYPEPSKWRYFPPEGLPALTETLLNRGYGEDEVRGILGGNFRRVVEQVWR